MRKFEKFVEYLNQANLRVVWLFSAQVAQVIIEWHVVSFGGCSVKTTFYSESQNNSRLSTITH